MDNAKLKDLAERLVVKSEENRKLFENLQIEKSAFSHPTFNLRTQSQSFDMKEKSTKQTNPGEAVDRRNNHDDI